MKDFLYRGIIDGLNARFAVVHATATVNAGVIAHNSDPASALLLCRALGSGLLISPLLQDDHRFTINWMYEGPAQKLTVDVGSDSDVRGLITGQNLSSIGSSINELYGEKGQIAVVRSNQKFIISSSVTEAGLLDIGDDLGFYFSTSEQIETDFEIGVNFRPDPEAPVSLCQGFMLQALPDCDLEKLDRARQRMRSQAFQDLLNSAPEVDNHVELLIQQLFDEDETNKEYSLHDCPEPKFQCKCNKEKTSLAINTLTLDDLQDYINNKEDIVVTCHFCCTPYTFGQTEIQQVIKDKSQDS